VRTSRKNRARSSNHGAELTLDGHVFHLEPGIVHFVNHGCVHAVRNEGTERRVHLVWDQLLTREAYGAVFGEDAGPTWATRMLDDERAPDPLRVELMGAYVRLPPLVDWDEAEGLDLCDTQ
jgi:hypothetical protein